MDLVHNVWSIFMPFLFIIGLLFVFSGYKMHQQRVIGKSIARIASLSIILWFILYGALSISLVPFLGFEDVNSLFFKILMAFSFVMSYVFICGYPTFLLFYPLDKMLKSDKVE